MPVILKKLIESLQEGLVNFIVSCVIGISQNLDSVLNDVTSTLGQTPQEWQGGTFMDIQLIAETVMMPVAGAIIAFVMTYELAYVLMETNNMHNFEPTTFIFQWLGKTAIAVMLVTNSVTISNAIFDVSKIIVTETRDVLLTEDSESSANGMAVRAIELKETLKEKPIEELIIIVLTLGLLNLITLATPYFITFILYGRMITIYLYLSVAPIPFATLGHRDLRGIGTNYIKALIAYSFQVFLMMVCVAIYRALVGSIDYSGDIFSITLFPIMCTLLLMFTLMRTGSISKQIFGVG